MAASAWTVIAPEAHALAAEGGWQRLIGHVVMRRAEGLRVLIVVPALPEAPALLDRLLRSAVKGAHAPALEALVHAHRAVAETYGLELAATVGAEMGELGRHALAVAVMAGARPALQAKVSALGPLLHTRLLSAWLTRELSPAGVELLDPRLGLRSREGHDARHWLSARCQPPAPDPEGIGALSVALVPAGVAADPAGEPVLLGRGGGPVSAALWGLRAAAVQVDALLSGPIPHSGPVDEVRDARPITELDYDEAEALGALGVAALHPVAVELLRGRGLPLRLFGSTGGAPLSVEADATPAEGGVRLVHARRGLAVLSVEVPFGDGEGELGARVLGAVNEHGLAPVVLAASRGAFSLAVDATDSDTLASLVGELQRLGRTTHIPACAAVSLLGSGLRSQLHRLGPALEALGPPRLRLVVQAADQRTITVVIDDALAEPLLRAIHSRLPVPGDDQEPVSGGAPEVQSQ